MTTLTSIEKIKREYATEDAQMIKENGTGSVAQTKLGCLHMSFENGVYSVFATKDLSEFKTTDVEVVIKFLMDQYQVIEA